MVGSVGRRRLVERYEPGVGLAAQDLVARARSGDEAALALLLAESRDRLLAEVAIRISPEFQGVLSAEDIVQEAHIAAFGRIGTFEDRGPGSFYRWLATIALRKLRNCIKHFRTVKRGGAADNGRQRSLNDSCVALLATLTGRLPTPSAVMAQGQAVGAIKGAVEELPERHRHAVWSVYIEGRPVREVAGAIGCTERAVHGLCRRGLKRLRSNFAGGYAALGSRGDSSAGAPRRCVD